jgi:hypothetical protein
MQSIINLDETSFTWKVQGYPDGQRWGQGGDLIVLVTYPGPGVHGAFDYCVVCMVTIIIIAVYM